MFLQETKPTKPNFLPHSTEFPGLIQPRIRSTILPPTLALPNPPQHAQPCRQNFSLDSVAYTKLVQFSTKSGSLIYGKAAHGHMIKTAFRSCLFLLNNLLHMYCECGEINSARQMFDRMPKHNVISYNSLLSGYSQMGLFVNAMEVFNEARVFGLKLDKFTYAGALNLCGQTGDLLLGKLIHGLVIVSGLGDKVFLTNSLIDMYSKCGQVNRAALLFECSNDLDEVSWNSLIAGYVRVGANEKMVKLVGKMHRSGMKLNTYALGSVLKACCTNFKDSNQHGKALHAFSVKLGLDLDDVVATALLDMYAKTGDLVDAIQLFKLMSNQSVIIYNAMIAGFLQGSVEDGVKCFALTPKLDIVLWTSIISGYVQNGHFGRALALFYELLSSGRKPDEFIISSMLGACSNLASPRSGQQIQGYAIKTGIGKFTIIQNSQICMYAKSGDIDSTHLTFEEMDNPDVVSWSVMISSNAQHGCARKALRLFELMKGYGIAPNHITFLGVLTACSHGGLVKEGLRYFESMKKDYCMTVNVRHCACIVDLLGRAGKLVDAENFILNSGFEKDPVMWRALLSACRVYKDTVTGKHVAERVIELEPQGSASYVLLYNIYNDARINLPATKIRELMNNRGVKKEPGLSWIEVGNEVHCFVVGDRSHPMSQVIYARLEEMMKRMEKLGYIEERPISSISEPKLKTSTVMNYHSEKLAVTYGILCLPASAPVRVMKNLRVCQDCHTMMKFLSRVEKREIILRDSIRFHHFREGTCSCGDYW
ncbi:pentatricopeptide repeat-containing protein At3g13880-like isoform X2 [Quercus robur]|uniref:pentatricopeptide repeat-containing protein At3g13880-like isoform X2 n=1 Tax=Quercus robur TaxID=38942 RepID=UPI00216296AC|nr:pentatricopeptide repeat-containing protein At3g13880-like isoform X2 [Quercus robur]